MPHTNRTVGDVLNIECTAVIESRQNANKEKAYSLVVTWSNFSTTQLDVLHSNLVELRTRLKNECYWNRPDVEVPEPPSTKMDISALIKREEKRKKAVQEFFSLLLKLPDVPYKMHILNEFLSGDSGSKANPNTPSAKPLVYAVVVKDPAFGPNDEATFSLDGVYEPVQYAELDSAPSMFDALKETTTANARKKPAARAAGDSASQPSDQSDSCSDPGPLYTEVTPRQTAAALLSKPRGHIVDKSLEKNQSDCSEVDGMVTRSPSNPLYMNVHSEDDSRSYENVCIGKRPDTNHQQGVAKKRYCKVTQDYVPKTSHTQGLAVKAGDVVLVQDQSNDRALCLKCASHLTPVAQPFEGWVPVNILTPCHPDIIEGADSPVPVYRAVDSKSAAKQELASKNRRRPPPLKANKTKKTSQQNTDETDNDLQDTIDSLRLSVPELPDCLSPSLSNPVDKSLFDSLSSRAKEKLQSTAETNSHASLIHVIAVADWSQSPSGSSEASRGLISFKTGDIGVLHYCSENRWWCVRIESTIGWVPAEYWRILADDGRIGSGDTAPWMVGVLERAECEQLLMRHGKQRDFVIRKSRNLAGQYALSVKYNGRLHHFPIEPKPNGKFYIGKHHFSTLENVIIYYSGNTLFVDEAGQHVTLGSPMRAVE